MTPVYFNEIDPYAARWLRNLYPEAHVDGRSITDVQAGDVLGFTRAHFFGGIGGWEYALDLAGWGDAPVWTGSVPCQPWSKAGRRGGAADERHLWPAFFRLIRQCKPAVVFGEQTPDGTDVWLDMVFDDLEGEGYACGAAVLPSAGVGNPSLRHRLFWVASLVGAGVAGLGPGQPARVPGPRRWRGEEDLQAVASAPFVATGRWPEPILCAVDARVSARVGRLRAAGNAIDPECAAVFIRAFMETTHDQP